MRTISFITLVAVMHASSALGCSIDMLKKAAEEHLEGLPSGPEREFAPSPPGEREGGGGSWQVFEDESGAPHSIVVTIRHELGQDRVRISFIKRGDFVIVSRGFYYAHSVRATEEERPERKYIMGSSGRYFFCDYKPQTLADAPDDLMRLSEAIYWQDQLFANESELKQDIQRVPE